jgi:tripartite ATP-independent transporter DctM subunit
MEAVALGFLLCMILIVVGVPIAMAFGALSVFLIVWFGSDPAYLMPTTFIKIRSVVLLSCPLFILFGMLLDSSGLAKRLIEFVNSIIGHIKGGLGAVTVVATAMFSAISGTDSAAIACIGTVMIPRLEDHGYPRGHATALVACSGILGQLVPPSVPMIFYAIITGNSIPAVWLATLGPAMIIVVMYSFLSAFAVRKLPIKVIARPESVGNYFKGVAKSTWLASPVLILPLIVLGGIYGGVVTPTEAACLGVFYVMLVAVFFYRAIGFTEVKNSMITAAVVSGVVILMIFFTEVSSKILVVEGVTEDLSTWLMAISPNVYVTLLLLNVVLLIMGMMMNDLSGTVLAAGLLYPIAIKAGIHPLHFAAIVGVNLGLGTVTPPTAPMLFLAGRIGNCAAEHYLRPAMFLMWVGMLPVLIVTTYWPGLSLAFPRWAGYIS